MARVLICDPVAEDALEAIRKGGHEVVEKIGMSPEELLETAPAFDALVIRSATKVRKPVLEKGAAGNLKLVVRGGVGLDNVDLDVAADLGIAVRNTPSASSVAVAELALAHMLACSRFLGPANYTMKHGEWNKKAYGKGKELWRSTLGLIGFGRIAQEVAKRAKGFEMDVVFFDPYIDSVDRIEAKKVDLETLCMESDFISLHIPHNDETHYLLDTKQFDMMKDGVVIVNCARGGTINETSLLEALNSGKVFAAGVDVFEEEPAKDNPLVKHGSTVATPHIGAGSAAAKKRVGSEVAREINEFFE
ncbi:MAG: D-2-hydroxyacid dehydrogenase [Candidatus Fermentibacteraceae bacterium]|nr:D-2-hydroxyacid dehydrogenase [Candidatus Fermentibacteraceae bacterium]